jgi:hypothetical protein
MKSISPSLHDFNFVVDALNQARIDLEIIPIQNAIFMPFNRVGQFDQQRNFSGSGRSNPFVQSPLGRGFFLEFPDLPDVFLQDVPGAQRGVYVEKGLKPLGSFRLVGDILPVGEERILDPIDGSLLGIGWITGHFEPLFV